MSPVVSQIRLFPFVSLYLAPVGSQPGCLARLSGWTGSFVSLSLFNLSDSLQLSPFVSLHCLPLSPSLDVWHGSPGGQVHLSPFVSLHCLLLSPSLDAWHGFVSGRIHLSSFVSLYLGPVGSQPGCLARLSGWTDCFPLSLSLNGFNCAPLSPSPSCCLPAWTPGTALWVDGFICLSRTHVRCIPRVGMCV